MKPYLYASALQPVTSPAAPFEPWWQTMIGCLAFWAIVLLLFILG